MEQLNRLTRSLRRARTIELPEGKSARYGDSDARWVCACPKSCGLQVEDHRKEEGGRSEKKKS